MKVLDIKFEDSMKVEESFYQAFCNQDIELMKNVWDKTDDVVCIHPGSLIICGFKPIIASWEKIFTGFASATIKTSEKIYRCEKDIAFHYLKEDVLLKQKRIAIVYATNIYCDTKNGWKMITHHASLAFKELNKQVNPSIH